MTVVRCRLTPVIQPLHRAEGLPGVLKLVVRHYVDGYLLVVIVGYVFESASSVTLNVTLR